MMTRADELRDALARAKQRHEYAEKEYARFLSAMEIGPEAARLSRKLRDDVTRARSDVQVLERELGRELGELERQMP
jgi:hypothetical protein